MMRRAGKILRSCAAIAFAWVMAMAFIPTADVEMAGPKSGPVGGWKIEEVSALSVPRLSAEVSTLTVGGSVMTYVQGTLMPAVGQKVQLYLEDRKTVIGSYRVKSDGGTGTFRIKVPQQVLGEKASRTLYVRSEPCGHVMSSRSVPVTVGTGQAGSGQNPGSSASGSSAGASTRPSSTGQKKTEGRPKTAAAGRAAAVAWAKKIAADNSFTYGAVPYSRHNGCYFCGTNGGKKRRAKGTRWANGYGDKKWNKTYCCNPFIHAAYAHGAKHPKMLKYCKKKRAIDMTKATYRKMGCFKCLGKPKFSKLIPGDVIVSRHHVSMYCGKGEIVEATWCGGGKKSWGASSIRVTRNGKKKYKKCRFVMRFTGY